MPQHTAFLRIGGFAREDVDAMINHRQFADVMRAASREGLRQVGGAWLDYAEAPCSGCSVQALLQSQVHQDSITVAGCFTLLV